MRGFNAWIDAEYDSGNAGGLDLAMPLPLVASDDGLPRVAARQFPIPPKTVARRRLAKHDQRPRSRLAYLANLGRRGLAQLLPHLRHLSLQDWF